MRRRLKKATSVLVDETRDSEETQSDEDVRKLASDSNVNKEEHIKKRRQKQPARTGPAAKKARTDKEKVSLVEEETEPIKEPVVSGSPTIEELDHQVDELLARPFLSEAVHEEVQEEQMGEKAEEELVVMDEEDDEEEGEGDVGSSTSERRYRRRPLFSPKRLSIPSSHQVRSCMDVMMGCANRATIKSLRRLPLRHTCAILCRNMAETSLLRGDVLRTAVQSDDRRCRRIDRLMEEKYALEQEIKELKFTCDSAAEISSHVKADVEMVMEENQLLEEKNEQLKSSLEGEKNKMKEKRKIVEERLPHQLDYAKKEAVREYVGSEECSAKFNGAFAFVLQNGFKIRITQVRELLMEDDELIPELEKMKINPKVKYEKEAIPSIESEPAVWSETYEAVPMKFIKEWGIEADISMDTPCPVKVVRPAPPITAPQALSMSASDVPPQHPMTIPPMSEQNIPPP
ncbi:hypothetical protein Dimus_005757 [Dionaea muscipula]